MAFFLKLFTVLTVCSVSFASPALRAKREETSSAAASSSGSNPFAQFGNYANMNQMQNYMNPQQLQGYVSNPQSAMSSFTGSLPTGNLPAFGSSPTRAKREETSSAAASSSGSNPFAQFGNYANMNQMQNYMNPQQLQGYVSNPQSAMSSFTGSLPTGNLPAFGSSPTRAKREETSSAAASSSAANPLSQFGNYANMNQLSQFQNMANTDQYTQLLNQFQGSFPTGNLPAFGSSPSKSKREESSSAAASSASSNPLSQFGNYANMNQINQMQNYMNPQQIQGYVSNPQSAMSSFTGSLPTGNLPAFGSSAATAA